MMVSRQNLVDFKVSHQYPTGKPNVPSDSLRSIYQLCEQFPALDELFDLPKPYEFIADSNAAIREVLFTSKYRRNEFARTDLRESLQSGVAKIIAPLALRIEMERHLPMLALEKGISENKLRQEWQELQTYIEFRDVAECEYSPAIVADPDDLPFVALYLNSSADAVLTYDKHISIMGAKAVRPDAIRFVRDYARSKAPEVTLRVGGVLIGGVALGSVIALLKLAVVALRSFLKLPVEYQLLVIAGLVLAFLHPASRKAIIGGITSLASGLKIPSDIFLEVIAELSVKFGEAQQDVRASQTILETTIPRRIVPAPIDQASSTNDKVVSASSDTVRSTLFSNELLVRNRVRTTSIRSKRNPKRRSARKRRMNHDTYAN